MKDPAFLFYSSDFYMGTIDMTPAQVGYYIRLLCLQHAKGHLSEALMTATMGGQFDEVVACKFLVDENRLYYNERLDEEAEKRNNYTDSRRKNLSKTPTHMREHMEQHMQEQNDVHMSQHMENENEDITNTIVPIKPKKGVAGETEKRFIALWALYPKKQGKTDAFNAYQRAVKDGVTDEQISCGIEAYVAYLKARNTEEKYIKIGGTFFNQRSWDDDYTVKDGKDGYERNTHGNAGNGHGAGQGGPDDSGDGDDYSQLQVIRC